MGGVRAICEAERDCHDSHERKLFIVDLGTCAHSKSAEAHDTDTRGHSARLSHIKDDELDELYNHTFVPVSEGFASPEQLLEAESVGTTEWAPCLPFASDVYAVGGIMAMLILGTAQDYLTCAWTAEDAWEYLKAALEASTVGRDMSREAIDLLSKIIAPEEERPTIHEVLQHPWFTEPALQERLKAEGAGVGDDWGNVAKMLDLRGTEPANYEAGDWIALSTGAGSDYVLSEASFEQCYAGYQQGKKIQEMTDEEKNIFPNWEIAQAREMSLFYRAPDYAQTLVKVTEGMINELLERFEGQTAKYVCDPNYPQRAGKCRLQGKMPTNAELLEFLVEKTGVKSEEGTHTLEYPQEAAWPCVRMLKKAVFAKQADIPGVMASTRALHSHIPGVTKAFAFNAYENAINIKMRFVVPGDYFKLSDSNKGIQVGGIGVGGLDWFNGCDAGLSRRCSFGGEESLRLPIIE